MLGKNNINGKLRKIQPQKQRFSIRKFAVGAASVLIGLTFMGTGNQTVKADVAPTSAQQGKPNVDDGEAEASSDSEKVTAEGAADQTKSEASSDTISKSSADDASSKVTDNKTTVTAQNSSTQNGGVNTQPEPQSVSGKSEEDVKQNDGESSEEKAADKVVDPDEKPEEVTAGTDELGANKSGNLTEEQLSKLLGASFVAKSNSDYISYKNAQEKVNTFNDSINNQLIDAIQDFYKAHTDINSDEKNAINAAIQEALKTKSKDVQTAPTSSAIAANEAKVNENNATQIANIEKQIEKYLEDYNQYKTDLNSYNSARKEYIQKLKKLGLWNGEDVDPATLSQLLSLKDEKQAKVTVKRYKDTKKDVAEENGSLLTDSEGNPLLTKFYHVKDTVEGKFLKVTYTNLKNSTYNGKKIKAIVVIYSDFETSDNPYQNGSTPGIYLGNNPLNGFFYKKASSVTMEMKMYYDYDKKTKKPSNIVNFTDNSAYVTVGSLNSEGKGSDYIEKAELLSDGQGVNLPESSVTVHKAKDGHDVLYSNKNNEIISGSNEEKIDEDAAEKVWSKKIVKDYSNWDNPSNKKDAIFGSGLFKVSGNSIKIKYSNKLGSAWAPFSTNIPKLAFTSKKPSKPELNITWQPSELKLHDGKDTTETDTRTRAVIDNFDGKKDKVIGTQKVTLTRTKTVDSVAGKTTYSDWKIADGNNGYVTYTDIPSHSGYTVSSINNRAISNADVINLESTQGKNKKDDPIIFNFTPDDQKAEVIYIDQNTGKSLKVDSLDGHSDERSGYTTKNTINDYVKNQHYEFVSDGTNGDEIVFDHNDDKDQSYEVVLKHATEPASDTVTVKQTIKYVYKNGNSASGDNVQSVDFKRTGTKDLVTNDVDWNAWNDGSYKTVESPEIAGYTPDKISIEGKEVKPTDKDSKVIVTYTPDNQEAMVEYLDDDANEEVIAQSLLLKGVTGEKSGYSTADTIGALESEGYKLVSDDTEKNGIVFDNDKELDQIYYVHFKHGKKVVTPEDPTPTPDPENLKTKVEALTHTQVRNIYQIFNGEKKLLGTQSIDYSRKALIDTVTKELITGGATYEGTAFNEDGYSQWLSEPVSGYSIVDPITFIGYTVHPGYTESDQGTNIALSATEAFNESGKNAEVDFTYIPKKQQAMVEYLDDDANEQLIAQSPILKGVTSEKSTYSTANTINTLESEGYEFVSDDTEKGIIFDNDDSSDQIYYVHMKHGKKVVTPDTPPTPEDPVDPDTPKNKTYGLTKTLSRDIYQIFNGEKKLLGTQSIDYIRNTIIDAVTKKQLTGDAVPATYEGISFNKDGYSEWTANLAGYSKVDPTTFIGYTTHQGYTESDQDTNIALSAVDALNKANNENKNAEVDFIYTPNAQQAMVEYVDDTEDAVISQQLLRGMTGEKNNYSTKSTIHDLTLEGYVLVSDGVPSDGIVFDNNDNADQVYYVHLKHGIKKVDKDHPGKPDNPINPTDPKDPTSPKGPNYPKGSSEEDLTDDVTRTINYVYSTKDENGNYIPVTDKDGKALVKTQTASFSAVGYLDTVTGKWVDQDGNEVESGKELTWSPDSATLDSVDSPLKPGYTVSQRTVDEITVNHDDEDIPVTVIYTPEVQKAHIKFVDDDSGESGTILATEDINDGHTDEGIQFKNASTTLQKYLDNFDFVSLVDETPQIATKHSFMLFATTPYVVAQSQKVLTTDANEALNYDLGKFNNDVDTDQQFVVHLKHHFEDGTRTRTVHQHVEYLYGEGDKQGTKLPTNIAQDFDKELTYSENGKVDKTYKAYQNGRSTNPIEDKTTWDESTIKQVNFDTVESPKMNGYHYDIPKVDPDDVTINNDNWDNDDLDATYQVRYYANPQTAHIKFYDDTANKFVQDDDGNDFEEIAQGKTGEEITLKKSLPRTRKALHSIMDENDHTLPYLPIFNMFDVSDADDMLDSNDSRKLADESSVQDHIGKFDDNDDRSQLFIVHVKTPTPAPQPDPDPKPTPAPETHKIIVTYKDSVTGETLDTKSLIGKSGESANYSTTSTINTFEAENYTLDSDETNGKPLTFSDSDQSYLVKLGHASENVTTPKIITRTIVGKKPNGDDINVKQEVTLIKVDTKDKVTGKITKQGTWNTGTWSKYDVPQFDGYTSQIEDKDGVQVTEKGVTSDTPNEVVHVSYVAIPSPDIPTPVPDTPSTTPSEDPQPNVPTPTPAQPSEAKKEVSQAPTPDTPKKKVAQPVVSKKVVVTPTIKKSTKTVSVTETKKVVSHVEKITSEKPVIVEKQNTLPQTGAKDENLAGMLGLMIASVGAIFGLAAGKKHKND